MRPQRAVLPLAFLSAAFMLGCQDQGLEPVGPEGLAPLFDPGGAGKGGPNKKGGSVLADITLTGGMVTPPAPLVQVVSFKDGNEKIELHRAKDEKKGLAGINLRFNLENTHTAPAGRGACVQGGPGSPDDAQLDTLFDELVIPVQEPLQELGSFWVSIPKTALGMTSEGGVINVTWREDDGTARQLVVGTHPNFPDEVATVATSSLDPLEFVFTGGSITVSHYPGGPRDKFRLICPNLDAITMVLVAQ